MQNTLNSSLAEMDAVQDPTTLTCRDLIVFHIMIINSEQQHELIKRCGMLHGTPILIKLQSCGDDKRLYLTNQKVAHL